MSLKVDIERAYDWMALFFLREVLLRFGFHETFIDLVMGFIEASSFSVMIIGNPSNWFTSNVGIQRGDPLSPYLLIIGAEILPCSFDR